MSSSHPEVAAADAAVARDRQVVATSGSVGIGLRFVRLGPIVILALLVAVIGSIEPIFFRWQNLQNLLVQTSPIAILALGQLMVIVSRGVDLSVGSTLSLCTVTGALAAGRHGADTGVTVLIILGTGLSVGLVNGLVLTKFGIPNPLIVTLGMLNIALGIALMLADGTTVPGVPIPIQDLAIDTFLGVPTPFLIALGLAGAFFVLGRLTQWGRWIYALGGNPEAAERAGIPVQRLTMSVYILSGLTAGFAAIIVSGRLGSGYARAGELSELDSIAAVVIGGASLFGGRGGVAAALVGALVIGTLRNGLNLIGVDSDLQYVAVGVVVILAVGMDIVRGKLEARFRLRQALHAQPTPNTT